MIGNILELLEIAKTQEEIGENTFIAIGKNKIYESIKEGLIIKKFEQCRKR